MSGLVTADLGRSRPDFGLNCSARVAHYPHRRYEEPDKLRRAEDGALGLVAKDAEHAWIVADDDPVVAQVQEAALRCYDALGCRHYGLFDFRVDPDGEPYFLEAGLYCSYARTSVVAVMAHAAGIGLDRLFALAVDDALRPPAAPDAPAGSAPTSPRTEE